MGGAIGAGVYFATHAQTSTGYVTGGHRKKMLYCRFALPLLQWMLSIYLSFRTNIEQ